MSQRYHTVRGVFDGARLSEAEDKPFPDSIESFGLSDRADDKRWEKVNTHLNDGTDMKLLFVGRHGQGVHNLAQEKYGKEKWQKEMCFKYGDDDLQWGPDPPLTELGEKQARSVGSMWREELQRNPPIPEPTLFFCSPLRRAAQTLSLTFDGVFAIDNKVMIREKLREKLDAHTPDKRMNMNVMRKEHPAWPTEADAAEEDIWWSEDTAETFDEYKARAGEIIDEIFQRSDKCVSITAHEGIIQGLLSYVGHPVSQPPVGNAFGLLVCKQPSQARGAF